MRILSIQSSVVAGYVGNRAACFPLQLLGNEVDQMNTVQFSNHTGYAKGFRGQRFDSAHLEELFKGLMINDFHLEYNAILTGYIGRTETSKTIAKYISIFKDLNPKVRIVVDPVLGDNDHLYVPEDLVPLYKELLIPLADLITPNGFEAKILSGIEPDLLNISVVLNKLHSLGPRQVVITSIESDRHLYLFGSTRNETKFSIKTAFLNYPFTGTGDTFSALLLSYTEKLSLEDACTKAVDTMIAILEKTIEIRGGKGELALIQSASLISNPPSSCVSVKMLEN